MLPITSSLNVRLWTVTVAPCVIIRLSPKMTEKLASVATKDGSLSQVISRAFASLSVILGLSLIITHGATVTVHNRTLSELVIGSIYGLVPSAALIAAVVFGVMAMLFFRTPFGRHVAATGGEVRAAIGAGVNIP